MFQIENGYVVDEQGLDAKADDIVELLDACAKSLALSNKERREKLRSHLERHHPGMVDQIAYHRWNKS